MSVDLEALERLAEAATRGPWRPGVLWSDGAYPVGPYSRHESAAKADAAFIAASREAVPALCREVRELRGLHDRLAKHIGLAADQYTNDLAMILDKHKAALEKAQGECAALREALERILDKGEPMSAAIAQDAIRPMRIVESRAALAKAVPR